MYTYKYIFFSVKEKDAEEEKETTIIMMIMSIEKIIIK